MDTSVEKPHRLVLDEVQKRWSSERSKGLLRKLFEFGGIKPVGIEIVETERLYSGFKYCAGKTLRRWRYDDTGLRLLPPTADTHEEKVEYVYYSIDRVRQRLAIVWANILSSASQSKKIHYFHNGTVYEIIEAGGVEDYELISTWIE